MLCSLSVFDGKWPRWQEPADECWGGNARPLDHRQTPLIHSQHNMKYARVLYVLTPRVATRVVGVRILVEMIQTVLDLLEDTVQIIACNFLRNFGLSCCFWPQGSGLYALSRSNHNYSILILICFIKKTSRNVIAATVRFDIHCGFRQISTMNGLSCIFSRFVWLIVCTCSVFYGVKAVMNNCSPSHCLQNGVGMLGLDWTKITISVSTCRRRQVFSNVFNTSNRKT